MILNVEGLRFSYRSAQVLNDVEFSIKEHEIVAIMGPNGVGKTTLLKCINTILKPTGGSVMVHNREITSLSQKEVAKNIGYVSQKNSAGGITVFDAVLLGRYPHIGWNTTSKDTSIVEQMLENLNLTHYALHSVDELSGGELQKVCTARALVQEPKILLLDEPTSALDLKNQLEILSLIKRVVSEQKVTAIMTMHDINLALRYADKFLFVKDGSIYAHCSREEITSDIIEHIYSVPVTLHTINNQPIIIPQGAN